MTEDRGSRSFSTATTWMTPFRSSTYAAFSDLPAGYAMEMKSVTEESRYEDRSVHTAADAGPEASTVTPVANRDS